MHVLAVRSAGLTIFALSNIIMSPDFNTDSEAQEASTLAGHEYFHHWTGVTAQQDLYLCTVQSCTPRKGMQMVAGQKQMVNCIWCVAPASICHD